MDFFGSLTSTNTNTTLNYKFKIMYTTTTATRDFALKATAAAERAMKRHQCCKSQYKFKCFSCGEMINRGDKITRCNRATTGMSLRFRGACSQNGLTMEETTFYQATTGENMWVHIGCVPCYWEFYEPLYSNEYTRPSLRPICTDWGVKVCGEWDEWCGSQHIDHDHFCLMKGYPKEKFMRDRIIHNVTRFQALWRGYIYKNAYPIARQREQRVRLFVWYQKWLSTSPQEGDHIEVLFNANERTESLYSGEVIEVQYRGLMDTKITVKYHYDGEMRKYTGEKFNLLKREGEEHKRKLGIEASFTGRIFVAAYTKKKKKKKKKEKQDDEGDLFLLDY